MNIPALSRLLAPHKLANLSDNTYVNAISSIPSLDIDVHPLAREMNMHESYDFGMDLDTAVEQLQRDSTLNPFNLEKYAPETQSDSWWSYLPVVLGLVLAILVIGFVAYLCRQRGWLTSASMRRLGSTNYHVPKEYEPTLTEEATAPPSAPNVYHDLRSQVAQIIREYADEARTTGYYPLNSTRVHNSPVGMPAPAYTHARSEDTAL